MNDKKFKESLTIEPNKQNEELLKIQEVIESKPNKEEMLDLIKELPFNCKEKLKQLYINQIIEIKKNTEYCKARIIKMKNNIA